MKTVFSLMLLLVLCFEVVAIGWAVIAFVSWVL
jgi:hypothetical protein